MKKQNYSASDFTHLLILQMLFCNFKLEDIKKYGIEILQQLCYEFSVDNVDIRSISKKEEKNIYEKYRRIQKSRFKKKDEVGSNC